MLGIDVSKNTLACALYDPAQGRFLWERTVAHTPAGLAELVARTPADVAWVLEPTGRYSLSVAKAAQAAGRQPLLAPSRKARQYLASLQDRAKCDRLDGRGLALFGSTRPPTHRLPPYPIKTPAVEELDQLLAARRGVVDALTSLRQRLPDLSYAEGPLKQAVADLERQRDALDAEIAAKAAQACPERVELQAVPGIGKVTATAAVSRLKSKRFTDPNQFVAYIGLDVAVLQSGKRKGEKGLTKQGDGELRRLFYLCARASLTARDSPFKAQYERERAKGLPKTAALNAVARKMAKVCWSLFTHGSKYQPEFVYQQRKLERTKTSSPSGESESGSEGPGPDPTRA
jgi:transposase